MRRPKGTGGDEGGAVTGAAGDAMGARGLEGFRQGHRRQAGGETACQPRRARAREAAQEEVMVRTPASHFASLVPLAKAMATRLSLLRKLPHKYGAMS